MKQHYLSLRVDSAQELDDPNDFDGWRLYSFCSRHYHYKDPEEIGLCSDQPVARGHKLKRKIKNGLAFFLSYYEHGNCIWFLRDGTCPIGVEFRWDGVETAGLLIWEQEARNLGSKTYEDRAKDAAGFLETYTAWVNGEGVYFCLEDDKGNDLDGCGGFYSIKEAIEAIKQSIDGKYAGWPILVNGDLAECVRDYYPIEGHPYIESEYDLEELPEPEYMI